MRKKRLITKGIGIFALASLISVPIVSCSSYNNFSNQDVVEIPSNDLGDSSNNSWTNNVSQDIIDASTADVDTYAEKTSNTDGASQNYLDFLANGDFSSYSGNANELPNDVLQYFYLLAFNNKDLVIKTQTAKVAAEETPNANNLTFNSPITLEQTLIIKANDNKTLNIGSKSFDLEKNKQYFLTIKIDNQNLKPNLNYYVSNFYLGWLVENTEFSFDNQTWSETNFNFTANSFSHVFKYKFTNLNQNQTYFDLKNQYEQDFYNTVTQEQLESQIKENINNQVETFLDYTDIGIDILSALKQNLPVDKMLSLLSKEIIRILVAANIVPKNLEKVLIQLLYGLDDGNGNNQEISFIELLDKNRNEIYELLRSYVGSLIDILGPYIDMFKPGIKTGDDDYNKINGLIGGLPDELKTIIYNDILGIDGKTPKSLLHVVLDNYTTLLNLVGNGNETINGIKELLDMILARDEASNSYQPIYDTLLKDSTNKKKLLDTIFKFVSIDENTKNIIQKLVVDNTGLNGENLRLLLESLYNFTYGMFGQNKEYTSLENRMINLEVIDNGFTQKPSLDKANKTITYKYDLSFKLKQKVTLDLTPIKKLIDKKAFNELMKDLIKNNVLNTLIDKSNMYEIVMKLIPNTLNLGISDNLLSFDFSANSENIWFKPIKNNDEYLNGIDFNTNLNIFYDDPSMILDITQNNDYLKNGNSEIAVPPILKATNITYSEFWRTIIRDLLTRSYEINFRTQISNDKVIANTNIYNENQFYSDYSFTNNLNTIDGASLANSLIATDENNYKKIYSSINPSYKYTWKDGEDETESYGRLPIISEAKIEEIKISSLVIDKNIEEQNLYSLKIVPYLNFQASFGFKLLVNPKIVLRVFLMQVDLYFPFNVYETNSKTYTNHVAKTVTYFNFATEGI